MINYPIKSSDNKLTYGLGIDLGKNKYESKIIIQFSDLDNQQQVRVSLDGEEILETHSEYHLLMLSNLLKKFNDSKEKDIPWPKPLDAPADTAEEEARKRKFEDCIRYFQA